MKSLNLIIIILITSLFFIFSCSKTPAESEDQGQSEQPKMEKEEFKAEIIRGNIASKNPLIRADFVEGLVKNGISAILNMTTCKLELDKNVKVVDMDISAKLQELNLWRINNTENNTDEKI